MDTYKLIIAVVVLGLIIALVWRLITKWKTRSTFTYEKIEEDTHIHVPTGSSERDVLRAIVRASFCLARPGGLGWLHFDESQNITKKLADKWIHLPGEREEIVVNMDYVQGRQCKTLIRREGSGHFILDGNDFERDRGNPEPVLEYALQLLAGERFTSMADASHTYKGESLDKRLAERGFKRLKGEGDWAFRKRIFPGFYAREADRALEFLMGKSAAEWGDMERMLVLTLAMKGDGSPSPAELAKFANGFADDPLVMWPAQP